MKKKIIPYRDLSFWRREDAPEKFPGRQRLPTTAP